MLPRKKNSNVWRVFDSVRSSLPHSTTLPNPDTLMAEIDFAIAAHEYCLSNSLLPSFSSPSSSSSSSSSSSNHKKSSSAYDLRLADEAYKAACASLAAGQPDAAVRSLRLAITSCPPDRASALSKLRSLLSIATSQQQQKPELDFRHIVLEDDQSSSKLTSPVLQPPAMCGVWERMASSRT